MSFVTFIVPTIGRDTLSRALDSVKAQTVSDWDAIVVADGVDIPNPDHVQIHVERLEQRFGTNNYGAIARNRGLDMATGEWVAFLDDDDRLDKQYAEWLHDEVADADFVIFRMTYEGGPVLPPGADILPCQVGISFSARLQFVKERNIKFDPGPNEDWHFIQTVLGHSARLKVSDHIAYYVRH